MRGGAEGSLSLCRGMDDGIILTLSDRISLRHAAWAMLAGDLAGEGTLALAPRPTGSSCTCSWLFSRCFRSIHRQSGDPPPFGEGAGSRLFKRWNRSKPLADRPFVRPSEDRSRVVRKIVCRSSKPFADHSKSPGRPSRGLALHDLCREEEESCVPIPDSCSLPSPL
jgi:hypothetical protein